MTAAKDKIAEEKIVAELKAAAEKRHTGPVAIHCEGSAVTVRKHPAGDTQQDDILEEYLWNSAQSMLIRVCYAVWEHIVGEDHQWGRFSTQRQAEQRVAAMFSPGSLGKGEYYIVRLYTTKPLE